MHTHSPLHMQTHAHIRLCVPTRCPLHPLAHSARFTHLCTHGPLAHLMNGPLHTCTHTALCTAVHTTAACTLMQLLHRAGDKSQGGSEEEEEEEEEAELNHGVVPRGGRQPCGCTASPTATGWNCAGVKGEAEHQQGFGWHRAMLMTFLPVPLLLHRGQLGNQSPLPSLRLRSRLLVSTSPPPPLPPERLLTAHTAPMGAEHPPLPARIRPIGWKPL